MSRPFNTSLADQFIALGEPKPCRKTGYISKGAAEAHIRALRTKEDRKPDRKRLEDLVAFKCWHRSCQESPWHVGHREKMGEK